MTNHNENQVSILSAVHNEERHIRSMIESVQQQTYEDWELLLVPDGCTDRTVELISDAASLDGRIKLIGTNAKIGKVQAFNLAWENASGTIIVLLAGDDEIPPRSLETRVSTVQQRASAPMVAYFRLRTMSDDPRHNALTLPKTGASHSGGTITLTAALAQQIFPIDPSLVSEDLWLTRAAESLAAEITERPEVVLHYRIHDRNSNPRNRTFAEMTLAMAARHRAWPALLEHFDRRLSDHTRNELTQYTKLEALRVSGAWFSILCIREVPLPDRLAYISMSNAIFFWVRKRMFRTLSGLRRR